MRMTLNEQQLDLLDHVLAYYVLSGMGGGDRDTPEDSEVMNDLQQRIAEARERAEEAKLR